MCNQWTSRFCHQWGLSSPPDDPVNAYVHSSNLDTNIDLTNNKNYVTPSSGNKVNYSFTNQTCTDICLWNARSIVNKLHNFSSFAYTSNYQIIAVTETWLTSSIYNKEILPSNFAIYRNDRGTRGGGVLLAVNLSIPSKIVSCPDDIKAIVIELFPQHPVKLCLVYNPPKTGLLYQQKLISFLSDNMQTDGNVIILGDFNTPDIDWHTLTADSNFSIQLCNLIFQYNYSQVVTSPTHEHGNLLDLVITNNDDIISDVQVHSEGTFIKSDYYLVSFKLKSILNHKPDSCPITILDYSKANYNGLNQFLSSIDYSTCYQSENVEFVWSFVKALLLQGIRRFIPTIKLKTTAHPKWFTPALRHQVKCIQTLKRRYHKSPTEHIKSRILLSENQFALESSLAKSSFESNLVNNFVTGNQTKIFQYIRSITKSHSIPSTIFHNDSSASNDNDKATIFNQFFHSVFSTNTTSSPLDRGVGTGPAGPATAGPMFPEPTIKNIIPLFVIKQIKSFYIIAAYLCHLIKELHYYIIERTRYQSSSSNNFVTN